MRGMEYTDRTGWDPTEIIASDSWVMQQKFDGTRVLIDLLTLDASQRSGALLRHTAATQWIPQIQQELTTLRLAGRPNTVLDGELMTETGTYYVFDIVDTAQLHTPLRDRLETLEALPASRRIVPVTTARTSEEKTRLVRACVDREGVVAKHLDGAYEPGRRVEHVVKMKNIHTAELIVMEVRVDPLSARLGVMTPRGPRTIVSASLIGKDPSITVGDIVEVDYLAWTGASLIQPRIVRRRFDKQATDCTIDQMATYSRQEAGR